MTRSPWMKCSIMHMMCVIIQVPHDMTHDAYHKLSSCEWCATNHLWCAASSVTRPIIQDMPHPAYITYVLHHLSWIYGQKVKHQYRGRQYVLIWWFFSHDTTLYCCITLRWPKDCSWCRPLPALLMNGAMDSGLLTTGPPIHSILHQWWACDVFLKEIDFQWRTFI